jgi:hypothetical protein
MKQTGFDALAAAMFLLVCASAATAQQGPPFFGGGTAYDPEVGVVQSGALLDASATVSADRKYVTITTGATNSDLRDLVQFPVVDIVGFVGGVNPAGNAALAGVGPDAPPAAAATNRNGINTSPAAIANQATVLNQRGMFLVAPLK